jgi:hypothetical protein
MKKTRAPSKINAVSAVKMEIEGCFKELALSTIVALSNSETGPGSLARSIHKGPWPKEITDLLNKLKNSVEEHLLTVYFEEKHDTKPDASGPFGIVTPKLEGSGNNTPQL